MTTICTGMNKKGLDPSGWVIGISIICTLLPRWEVGSQQLLQGWSPPLETAMKREERGLGVLLALCQGMIAGTWVGSSFWKGLDVCLDMCWWPGILWQPFQHFSHQWVNASLKENDFFLSWTYPEVTAWKKGSLLSVISMSMDLLMPKESFWLFLHLLEVHLLGTNVDWLLLVDSLMFQRKTIATTLRMDWSWEKQSWKPSSYCHTSLLLQQGLLDLECAFWGLYISKMLLNRSMHLFLQLSVKTALAFSLIATLLKKMDHKLFPLEIQFFQMNHTTWFLSPFPQNNSKKMVFWPYS